MNKRGIYIHIPFCVQKCNYCAFLSFNAESSPRKEYTDALVQEIRCRGEALGHPEVDTVYVGGGTPSVLDLSQMRDIMTAVSESFSVKPDAEMTIEANPGTLGRKDGVTLAKLQAYKYLGFNRLSMGVQSANNDLLKIIGRRHNFRQAQDAFQMAREAGFDNISVDLIYGLPTQTKSDWAESVQKILEMHPEHISCYGLKLEEGTPMYEEYLNSPVLPDDDEQADMYFYAAETLARYGYEQYEISNFAARGFESRHNLKYWNLDDYMGFGPGAASSVGKLRYSYIKDLKRYISCVRRRTSLMEEYEELSTLERSVEYIMLGMRTSRGISENDYRERAQSSWQAIYRVLLAFQEKGWVEQTGDRWHFTVPGYLISNTLIGILLEAQAAGRVENIPWLARGDRAEKPLSMPKSEDEIFAEMYEQTKANAD